jgi:uncharacterized protein YndB with AHSA1/START domain
MARIETQRTIRAPREELFDATAHIEEYAEVIPHITAVEFLTDQRVGAGTRFRETRQMGRRSATTELEVTEYERPARVRLVSEAGGATWDTTFVYTNTEAGTDVHMVMDIQPRTFLARIVTPLIKGSVAKAVGADIDAVKQHFEGP